jgi:hypothetical protein
MSPDSIAVGPQDNTLDFRKLLDKAFRIKQKRVHGGTLSRHLTARTAAVADSAESVDGKVYSRPVLVP